MSDAVHFDLDLDPLTAANDSDLQFEFCNATWASEHDEEEVSWPKLILLGIPAAAIILLTVCGNLLVLCFKARVGRRNTTLLVWNLGLADFLVGLIVLPLGVVYLIGRKWVFGRTLCRIWVCCDIIFCTSSIITICVISADRYLAVTRPLRYKTLVTKCKVIGVMMSTWLFSSSILLTTVRWDQPTCVDPSVCFAGNEIRYLAHSVVFAFFIPAAVTLTLYWRIYSLARNRQRALDRGFLMVLGHNMNFLTNTISQQTPLRVHFGRNNGVVEHQRRVLRTHERIAKTLGVVSCAFLFCWLPFFTLYLANFSCRSCVPPLALDVASWLGYCNSMINPIIYSFTVKEFKKSALRLVLPLWALLSRCVPCIPAPPEHFSSRMSRTGQRVRGKSKNRPRSVELKQRAAIAAQNRRQHSNHRRVPTNRRQTEPAVFAAIDDDESEICCDGLVGEEHSDTVGNGTTGGNRVASSHDSHYSIRLYCVTQEASC